MKIWHFLSSTTYKTMAVIILVTLLILGPAYIQGQVDNDTEGQEAKSSDIENWTDFWVVRLALNLLGYATLAVPGYMFIRWVKKKNYLDTAKPGCMTNLIRLFVFGSDGESGIIGDKDSQSTPSEDKSFMWQCSVLFCCFLGLQGSYLTWGLLQERIMSYEYGATDGGKGEYFKDSQFLVFVNRILAFMTAVLVLVVRRQPRHKAPLYKYSYSSFSNIMSSWCQYEALKFVSFPTQVLAKASKVIPVMLMGKVVSKKTYSTYEYVTAVMISLGVSMFLLTSHDSVKDDSTVTTFSGVIILLGYLLFDAFTSNWQGELFRQYKMSPIQMMAGVNMFSVCFTSVSLLQQGGFIQSMAFMARHPTFVWHSVLLSICSATGQLFIFYTISQFGAVTFTIIMTIRQGLAILLSCLMYGHPVTLIGIAGVLTVFAAIFTRIYFGQQNKQAKKPPVAKPQPDDSEVPAKIVTKS